MSQDVVRRFEVYATAPALLEDVAQTLRTAEKQGRATIDMLERVQRPRSLQVRLTGDADKIGGVMEDIRLENVEILRDYVDLPSAAQPDRSSGSQVSTED